MSGKITTAGAQATAITEALPAGTANIGDVDVASIAAGDNNIGNVDIVTVPAPLSTTGGGTEAAALRVTLASDSTGVVSVDDNGGSLTVDGSVSLAAAVPAGTNNIGDVDVLTVPADPFGANADAAATAGSTGSIQAKLRLMTSQLDAIQTAVETLDNTVSGTELQVDVLTMPSTTVTATDLDIRDLTAASDNVAIRPETANGLSTFRSLDLDETEEEVKGTAGQVYGVWFSNTATSTRWLKFYNATAANVTVGTTTPVITLALPGNSSDDISGVFSSTHGIAFGTAITVAATTGVADNDTGAPGANEVIVNVFYK